MSTSAIRKVGSVAVSLTLGLTLVLAKNRSCRDVELMKYLGPSPEVRSKTAGQSAILRISGMKKAPIGAKSELLPFSWTEKSDTN